jgi:hypothetical protein
LQNSPNTPHDRAHIERSRTTSRSLSFCALALLASLLWSAEVFAQQPVPEGMNPYIYGMHDNPDHGLFERSGCGRGWITELRYIGADSQCETIDMSSATSKGFGVIMRLDFNGTIAQPPNSADWDGYAKAFAECVRKSKGVRVWVVGNEPNIPWGHPENRSFRGDEYGNIYKRVLNEVNKLPNAADHHILFAAMAPWAAIDPWGYWDDGLSQALDTAGVVDGVAIHAYSRNWYDPAAITSNEGFPNPAVQDRWHHHFRGYRDTLDILRTKNMLNIPIYITESGNACDPPCTPYPDVDNGYFFAMFQEVYNWNQAHPDQIIRAVTPYRWTQNDDGSGRDFCIGCKGGLKADISRAVDQGWKWTDGVCSNQAPSCTPQCGGKMCGADGCGGSCGMCAGAQMCDTNGQCISPPQEDMGTSNPGMDMSQPPSPDMGMTQEPPEDMAAPSEDMSSSGGDNALPGNMGMGSDSPGETTPAQGDGETIAGEGGIGCTQAPRGRPRPLLWLVGVLMFGAWSRRRGHDRGNGPNSQGNSSRQTRESGS